MLPIFVTLLLGSVETARALIQANAIEKGLRVGAYYVGRSPLPLSTADESVLENLVKTGTVDGSGQPLLPGWLNPGATVVVDQLGSFDAGGGQMVPVLRITANVPFTPILPWSPGNFTFTLSHEQAYLR